MKRIAFQVLTTRIQKTTSASPTDAQTDMCTSLLASAALPACCSPCQPRSALCDAPLTHASSHPLIRHSPPQLHDTHVPLRLRKRLVVPVSKHGARSRWLSPHHLRFRCSMQCAQRHAGVPSVPASGLCHTCTPVQAFCTQIGRAGQMAPEMATS